MIRSKTPKLRFPEFTEEWQEKRLDEIFTERKESCVISEEYPQLAFTIAEGVINPEDKKTNKRDFLIKDIETKKFAVTEVDDIIYNPANLKFGAIHRNKLKRGGVSPIYAIFSTEQSPAFMEYLVKRPSFIQESLKYLEGTVIKLMTLKPRDFLLMKTHIPCIPEQKKIAKLFTTLDSYIEIERKKTDSYKTLKASMLQKMFPRQGSSEPEIRFPEFTEAWEQRKVSEIADRYDNLRIPVAANLRVSGSTPYYGANGIQDYVDGFTHDGEFVLVAEDGANDLKNYPVRYVKGRIWVNNHAHVLQGKEKVADNLFLSYGLGRADIESLLVGGGRAKLNAEIMMGIDIQLPSYLEQTKIGAYFKQIDNLITLHQRKCEQLQLLKHSLQQKMFV